MPRESRSGSSPPTGSGDRVTSSRSSVNGIFRKDGEYWTVGYRTSAFQLKDTKGFAYLAHLLRHPGTEFHALDLAGGIAGQRDDDETVQSARGLPRGDEDLEKAGIHVGNLGDAGEMLDDQAKSAYRRRLSELREELEEAKELGNVERAERAEEEIDALTTELSRAVGLGGRNRRAASASERARQSIAKTIKSVLERIAQSDAALGDIFSRCIKTGTFCSYQPDPDSPDLRGNSQRETQIRLSSLRRTVDKSGSRPALADHPRGLAGGAGGFAVLSGRTNCFCGTRIGRQRNSRGHRSCARRPRIDCHALGWTRRGQDPPCDGDGGVRVAHGIPMLGRALLRKRRAVSLTFRSPRSSKIIWRRRRASKTIRRQIGTSRQNWLKWRRVFGEFFPIFRNRWICRQRNSAAIFSKASPRRWRGRLEPGRTCT